MFDLRWPFISVYIMVLGDSCCWGWGAEDGEAAGGNALGVEMPGTPSRSEEMFQRCERLPVAAKAQPKRQPRPSRSWVDINGHRWTSGWAVGIRGGHVWSDMGWHGAFLIQVVTAWQPCIQHQLRIVQQVWGPKSPGTHRITEKSHQGSGDEWG